ncbi:hypothetical protein HR060_10780 [Catenovulum sp. SM1970]|uniref:hypothetical protein n=1 Tax=Marinifaba aquimaris TaxID=2741323 RepID=UPI001571DFF1|nr:hypothetical protein [Marinifaba aquimaris]NTS77349.1 hypothetical protein [Marinifaba aquimaris]
MKNEQVKLIVESILNETILDDWYFYALIFSVSLVGAVFGSFIKSFGAEKGKYKAIESSLDVIIDQVSRTTETTEEIKNDFELNYWKKKERATLKREKLEEYYLLVLVSQESIHCEVLNTFHGEANDYDQLAYDKADMLQALYLPELETEHRYYKRAMHEYKKWFAGAMNSRVERIRNGENTKSPTQEYIDKYADARRGFNPALLAIKEKARRLATELNTQ